MLPSILNPEAKIEVARHGREQQPVLVIDDILDDPDRWRSEAAGAAYGRIGAHYPGIRAPVDPAAAGRMRDELAGVIGDTFGLHPVPPVFECYFSIVTTRPQSLAPIQRLPHVDGLEPERIAILIYLSGAEMGGTAFYRQRATGFETLDADRYRTFEAALKADVARYGLPPPSYIAGDTDIYERLAGYEARPNRAIIYRSHTLHCAEIPPDVALPADPVRGRLSINSFLFDPGATPQAR